MNYRAILLIASGVILGAATLSAVSVSAHDNEDETGRRGHHEMQIEGAKEKRSEKHHETVSEVLGITTDELKTELDSGKTMEEIVSAQGYESIESFKEAVENKVRENLAAEGLSEEEIDAKLERHKKRMDHRMEHLSEDFDEVEFRERLSDRGLSEEEINNKIQHIQDRIERFEQE